MATFGTARPTARPREAIAAGPAGLESYAPERIAAAGGRLVEPAEASGLMWMTSGHPAALADVLAANPHIEWVQLPFAGVENFITVMGPDRIWTCGKGVYAEPVGEHGVALTLALLRRFPERVRATSWGPRTGRSLADAKVAVLGAGGIAEVYLELIAPLRPEVTVVRRSPEPMRGATRTVGLDQLDEVLAWADVVFICWALTPETTGLLDARRLSLIGKDGIVVNVGRGGHIVTDDLVSVLSDGRLGGAGLDVTDPEPLPEGHPLWHLDNVIITPHTANTPEMAAPMLGRRVEENVRRWIAGDALIGLYDAATGY